MTKLSILARKIAVVAQFMNINQDTNAVVQSTTTLLRINVVILRISFPVRSLVQFINFLSDTVQ